jgi:hypothetical protein
MLLFLGEWSKHIGVSAVNELDGSCWFPVPNDTGSVMLSRCDESLYTLHVGLLFPARPLFVLAGNTILSSFFYVFSHF